MGEVPAQQIPLEVVSPDSLGHALRPLVEQVCHLPLLAPVHLALPSASDRLERAPVGAVEVQPEEAQQPGKIEHFNESEQVGPPALHRSGELPVVHSLDVIRPWVHIQPEGLVAQGVLGERQTRAVNTLPLYEDHHVAAQHGAIVLKPVDRLVIAIEQRRIAGKVGPFGRGGGRGGLAVTDEREWRVEDGAVGVVQEREALLGADFSEVGHIDVDREVGRAGAGVRRVLTALGLAVCPEEFVLVREKVEGVSVKAVVDVDGVAPIQHGTRHLHEVSYPQVGVGRHGPPASPHRRLPQPLL
mmetsp:Transcript_13650/g.39362  ORF Transcript_13650/g.39362 Transcript_13650/m.39362 type:complete len:300 (-) Transcript_13650:122-1021(-)